jgi:MoxR-like ATPase
MVLATQNPIEQEGTYPLPEAQMDRFLLHVVVHHPDDDEEKQILKLVRGEESGAAGETGRLSQQVIFEARREVSAVTSAEAIVDYIVSLVAATRRPGDFGEKLAQWIHVGVSPRATIALDRASRARAWLEGRDHVLPEDVRAIAHGCLRHRLILSYDASADGVTADAVIDELLVQVAIPS